MKRNEFLNRQDLPDGLFTAELGVDGELAQYCCWLREQVAAYGKIPPVKICPGDDTRELADIIDGYDALDFHIKAEERFHTRIEDAAAPQLFPVFSIFGMWISGEPVTFGRWCIDFATTIEKGRHD